MIDFIREKKAIDPVVLDVHAHSGLCDYFIICSGETARQVEAIYEEVAKQCKRSKIEISHAERDAASHWLLVDFFDVILHIFVVPAREFYNLEYLWNQAEKARIKKK